MTVAKMSYRRRMRRNLLMLSLLPMFAIIIFTLTYSVPRHIRETIDLSVANCMQVVSGIDRSLSEMDMLTRMIYIRKDNDKNLTSFLEEPIPEGEYQQLKIERLFRDAFIEISTFHTDLVGISLLGVNGSKYDYYQRYAVSGINLQHQLEDYRASKTPPSAFVVGAHLSCQTDQNSQVFTIFSPIWNANLSHVVAVMALDYSLDSIRDSSVDLLMDEGEETIIYTTQGDMIYSNRREYLNQKLDKTLFDTLAQVGESSSLIDYNGAKYYAVKSESNNPSIMTVSLLPRSALLAKSMTMLLVIVVIMAVLTMLVVLVSARLSRQLSEPIRGILVGVGDIKSGKFNTRFPAQRDEEFDFLAGGLNSMITTIQELINQKYALQLRKKDAELKALISQINPHFINNTLEFISGIATEKQVPQICETVDALGEMLYYSVKTSGNIVTLRQELRQVDNLMLIYNRRYDLNIQVACNIQEDFLEARILKLMLQPIVENSIKYCKKMQDLQITISAYKTEEYFVITVEDNACGIAKEKLERLNIELENAANSPMDSFESNSLGLRNVQTRILLYYGMEYGLRVQSDGSGATIALRLPSQEVFKNV